MKNWKNLSNIILSPSKVYRQINEQPTWLFPFLIVSIGTVLLSWFNLPLLEKVVFAALPPDELPQEQMKGIYQIGQIIGIIIAPAGILINWLFSSILLWAITYLFDERTLFKKIFSLVSHCSIISFIGTLLSWMILRLRGVETISTLDDLNVSLGVLLLFNKDGLSAPVRALLSQFNIFSVWYWIVLGLGLSIIFGFSRKRAAIVIGSAWSVSLAFSVGLAMIGILNKSGAPTS